MKKNRNTFFNEANMSYGFNPNMGMPQNMPVQSTSAYNSFYSGPNPTPNMGAMPNNYGTTSDLDSRLAKMERQISRLEYRLNKLENANTFISEDIDASTNNMYML